MPSTSATQVRIQQLSALIHQYNYSYYCGNSTAESGKSCNDETYDALVLELKRLEKQSPEMMNKRLSNPENQRRTALQLSKQETSCADAEFGKCLFTGRT